MLTAGRNLLVQGVLGALAFLFVTSLILQTFFSFQLLGIARQWFSMVVRLVWNGPVAQGGSFEDMTEIYDRLQKKMALPGEAAAYVKRLHVLLVNYYDAPRGMTNAAGISTKMTPVSLDLRAVGDAGYLIFYNAPTLWRVRNANGKRARLGFESGSPMDISPNPDGVVAGLRVSPITGRPFWFDFESDGARHAFCIKLRIWRNIFGAPMGRVQVWHAQMPVRGGTLFLRRNGPKSDSAGIVRRGPLRLICRR